MDRVRTRLEKLQRRIVDGRLKAAEKVGAAAFALLNRCELLSGKIKGLIFDGNLIVPLSFEGKIDQEWSMNDKGGTPPAIPAMRGRKAQDIAASATDFAPTNPPNKLEVGLATDTRIEAARFNFSGIYEFEMEDEACLIKKGLMKSYQERSPGEMLGPVPRDALMRMRQMTRPDKYWERACPHDKGWLIVDAVSGDVPTYLMGHGSFVTPT
jgi:hypothetical protein